MRVGLSNRHAVEKPGFFGRAMLTYTLAIAVELDDVELAAIEQKNIYGRLLFEPPWHPMWRIPEGELVPALLVHHLVEIHESGIFTAIGYYETDYDRLIGTNQLYRALEELKQVLAVTTPETVWFDI